MEVATKKIKILVEEKTTNDGSNRKFKAYRAVTKNGVKITAKFRKDCANVPTESCYIIVKTTDANMQKNTEYPTLWVSNVESIEPLEKTNVDNAKELDEMFG